MANLKFRTSHRTWEDWLGIFLGIAIALAPWVVGETANEPALINAAVVGFATMILAELDLVSFRRWSEAGQIVCGAWVAASPFIFGYSGGGALRAWNFAAGALVALLGVVELWQYENKK